MRHLNALIICGVSLFCSLSVHASALTAETMWRLKRLSAPSLSPDGKLAVLAVTRYELDQNRGYSDLWIVPTDGSGPRALTDDSAGYSEPRFSPDGSWIAFVAQRRDDTASQLYVIAPDGTQLRRVTDVPTGVSGVEWFPDSRRLAFVSKVWPQRSWESMREQLRPRSPKEPSAMVWERAPFSSWDHFLDGRAAHLFSVDLSGGEPRPITPATGYALSVHGADADAYDIAPDGAEIAFAADVDRSGIDPNYDIFLIPTRGGPPRNITSENPARDGRPLYSPDGRYLAFASQTIPRFWGDKARLMRWDRVNQRVVNLTADWDRSVDEAQWSQNSRELYVATEDAGTRRIYGIEHGKAPRAVTKDSSYSSLRAAGGVLAALRSSFAEPPTLVRIQPRSAEIAKLSTFNDAMLSTVRFGNIESVTYKGARADDVQMWIVYPPDFDPQRRYPVYMLMHGGPHVSALDAMSWRWNAHVFAGWGYIVTWHNFHGSSGFGQRFVDSLHPDTVSLPYEDTMLAARYLMAQPYVDPERMVAGGGSYGGYLIASILGRDHPFKALVAHAPEYNSYTQYSADLYAQKPRSFHHWEQPALFARYSPHMYAASFNTPTLVSHGQLDRQVPVNHGFELFNTLQARGVPSKLIYFPDENHWIEQPQNLLLWYRHTRDWLARYVGEDVRAFHDE